MFDKFTNRAKQVIKPAKKEAQRLNHNYLGTEHVLLGLLRQTDGVAAQVLENLNVNLKEVRKEVLKELETFNLQLPPIGGTAPGAGQSPRQFEKAGGGVAGAEKMPALKAYGYDITEACREGRLDPVIGR